MVLAAPSALALEPFILCVRPVAAIMVKVFLAKTASTIQAFATVVVITTVARVPVPVSPTAVPAKGVDWSTLSKDIETKWEFPAAEV